MIARYLSATGTGTLMALSLLYVMQLLIGIQPGVISDPSPGIPVDWISLTKQEKSPPPPKPKVDKRKITDSPVPPARRNYGGESIRVTPAVPTSTAVPSIELGIESAFVDGPLVSLMRSAPIYPVDAARRGLEGYVIVEFDVLETGYVANVRVIESSHRVFEKSAVRAASKFRFKPLVIDGVPLPTIGLRNRFRFEMDDMN